MTGVEKGSGAEEPPPLLGTWPRLYAVVLVSLVVEIVLFYLVTRAFS